MKTSGEVVEQLRLLLSARHIKQDDIGRVLDWPQPRVSELINGKRKAALSFDQANKLIEAFGLLGEEEPTLPSVRFLRLAVRALAKRLDRPLDEADPQVQSHAEFLRLLVALGTDPQLRDDLEAVERLIQDREQAGTKDGGARAA
jgi:predicted XRE-type DNA-binding protein